MTLVLVTRPRPEADSTAAAVAALGHRALVEPLLDIRLLPLPGLELDGLQGVVATSVNGVRALAGATDVRSLPLYAVGGKTAAMARDAGFASVVEGGGDAASLAGLLARTLDPRAGPLLHVSGADVAADLGALLAPAGIGVRRVVGYQAVAAGRLSPDVQLALAEGRIGAALFFSPRTARTFASLCTIEGVSAACAGLTALCLSQAVADGLAGLGWGAVRVAERPTQEALLALLPPA
ncbi:uroporphyrinogen-III synthase [Aerophototrophica crusticola]|uniref:Uroporphyrinogen-III synthase n=1 Tax=Aerophototrophica crusticola TaxID=1709002 RepID=A0A858R727_9PROT|nr:uroporphyrinogen-III synthase [Rhodospirillaceae bacterium B3]